MNRRGPRISVEPQVSLLETRPLLSIAMPQVPAIHPLVALSPNGQQAPFVNAVNNRRSLAASTTHRINEAFQAFAYHALHRPIDLPGGTRPISGIPVGVVPTLPTLPNELALLEMQVDQALSTIQVISQPARPSVANGPKFTPLARRALIPFAQQQIAQLGTTLAENPPVFLPDGTLSGPESLEAVDWTYNAILNAVAENAVHPKLFRTAADFYINPAVKFTLRFDGDPVAAGPGFYTHGPRGVPLKG